MSEQPAPTLNASRPIIDLVLEDVSDPEIRADFRRRDAKGLVSYGTHLQAHNGRDALCDAYEEALDLAMYLRQWLEEAENNGQRADRRRLYWDVLRLVEGLRRHVEGAP